MASAGPRRAQYRRRRWPLWDPAAMEWQPLRIDEKPMTAWQATRGAGLNGLRWLRRDRRHERTMPKSVIGRMLSDRTRAETAAMRTVPEADPDLRARLSEIKTPADAIRLRLRTRSYGSVFWADEFRGDPELVAEVLAETASDPDSGLEELAPGFWCRGVPPSKIADDSIGPMRLSPAYVGLKYAGRGSGFASMHALHRAGWTTQMTAKCRLAVMDGTPPPLSPVVIHEPRSNPMRLSLGWAEITLLEALLMLRMSETDIETIIVGLNDGTTVRRMGQTAVIRRERVRDAYEAETAGADDAEQHAARAILEGTPPCLNAFALNAGWAQTQYWWQSE